MGWFKRLSEKVDRLADPDDRSQDNPDWEITKADEKARKAREADERERGQR